MWKLNTHSRTTNGSKKKPKGKLKSTWDNQKWKHNDPKPMGYSKSSSKREVYSNTILPKKQETSQINNANLTPKAIRERTKKTQS